MDLGVPQRLLYESLKFARAFQILQTSAKIRWSHYRVLLRVPTKQGRDYYVRQTKKHAWSVGDLEVHVKGRLFEHTRGDSQAPLEELPKGRLYVLPGNRVRRQGEAGSGIQNAVGIGGRVNGRVGAGEGSAVPS